MWFSTIYLEEYSLWRTQCWPRDPCRSRACVTQGLQGMGRRSMVGGGGHLLTQRCRLSAGPCHKPGSAKRNMDHCGSDAHTAQETGRWIRQLSGVSVAGYPLHRKNRKMATKKSCQGKLEISLSKLCQLKHKENTGNVICPSCKFPDSMGKRYFNICRENFRFFS